MSITEIEAKAREPQDLKRIKEDPEAEITATEDAIKVAMDDRGADHRRSLQDHLEGRHQQPP